LVAPTRDWLAMKCVNSHISQSLPSDGDVPRFHPTDDLSSHPLDPPDVFLAICYKSSCRCPASRLRTKSPPATGSSLCLSNADTSDSLVHRPRYLSALAIDTTNPRTFLRTDTLDQPPSSEPSHKLYSSVEAVLYRTTNHHCG
jgi:hypothetical protein